MRPSMNRTESSKSTLNVLYPNLSEEKKLPQTSTELIGIASLSNREAKTTTLNKRKVEVVVKEKPDVVKTKSWIKNNFLCFGLTRLGLFAATSYSLTGLPFEKARKKMNQTVDVLSGSLHLSSAFSSLSPIIANQLRKSLLDIDMYKGIHDFLKNQQSSFTKLISYLLPQMYINMVGYIQENAPQHSGPVTIVEVLALITAIINAQMPRINNLYDNTMQIQDLNKRERKQCQIFEPLVEEFFRIALPNGMKSLPLLPIPYLTTTSGLNWIQGKLQKEVLPKLALDLYRKMREPLNTDKKNDLSALPGGESLASLAALAAQKTGENISDIFKDDFSDDGMAPFMKKLQVTLVSIFTTTERAKEWLSKWMTRQIFDAATTPQQNINQLRMFLGSYVEPVLNHVFYHLADVPAERNKEQGKTPDVLGVIMIRVFSLISTFFNKYSRVIEERIDILRQTDQVIDQDSHLLLIFSLLRDELLAQMGLKTADELPIPTFLRSIAFEGINDFLPKFLLNQYLAIKNSTIDDDPTRKKLRSWMLDPAHIVKSAVTAKVVAGLHSKGPLSKNTMFDDFYSSLWKETGTDELAATIERVCAVYASDIVAATLRYFGVAVQEQLKPEVNPFMEQTTNYLNKLVESMLLEAVVNIVDSTEMTTSQEGVHPKRKVVADVSFRMLDIIFRGVNNIDQRMKEIMQTAAGNKRELNQEMRKAFSSFGSEVHALPNANLLSNIPVDGLPGNKNIKKNLWESIRENLLPDFLRTTYHEVTSWESQLNASQETLEKLYHTTHPFWASHVMAQFVSDWLKNYLVHSSDEAAKSLLQSLINYFNNAKIEEGKLVVEDIKKHSLATQNIISDNLHEFGANEIAQMNALWPKLTIYIESVIAKFFAEISKTIHEVETENPDFLTDITITMLKDTAAYFEAVNKASGEVGEQTEYMQDPTAMLAAIGDQLHDGIPVDSNASPDENERVRLEGHFIPLAAKLFDLANIGIEDLPLPAAMRTQLGELLLNKLLPKALLQANSKVLEHSMRDTMMLKFLQTLHTALNNIKPVREETPIEQKASIDPKQKKLVETCGKFVLELVKLIPDTMIQYVFMKEKVNKMSAETIGEAMMPHLSKWTLLQIIDTALFNGLTNFHPSYWKGKTGREVLVPRKAAVRPDGKTEFKEAKRFKFTFPATPAELEAERLNKQQQARKTRTDLRDGITGTISSQLLAKAWVAIKVLWASLQSHLDDFIEKYFAQRGPKIKAFLDDIFRKVFFDVIGSVVQFLATPFIKLIQFILEKMYVDKRSEDIIEGFHSKALEHLLYKWTDAVINTLLKMRKEKQAVITV